MAAFRGPGPAFPATANLPTLGAASFGENGAMLLRGWRLRLVAGALSCGSFAFLAGYAASARVPAAPGMASLGPGAVAVLPPPQALEAPLRALRSLVPKPPARPAPAKPRPAAVAYRTSVRAGVRLRMVQMDPRSPQLRIAIATARGGIGRQDDWSRMIDRTRPAAAITGTYFCTETLVPVGSIVMGGLRIHEGSVGTVFRFSPGRGAQVVSWPAGRRYPWAADETALRAGPRLLAGGRYVASPRAEGFRDPAVFRRKRRAAIATTRHGKLLLVAVEKPVLLRELAAALKAEGAVDAMCLDGGDSTGLYYRGRTRVKPGRPLTNLLLVYESEARLDRHADSLNPGVQLMLTEAGRTGS